MMAGLGEGILGKYSCLSKKLMELSARTNGAWEKGTLLGHPLQGHHKSTLWSTLKTLGRSLVCPSQQGLL